MEKKKTGWEKNFDKSVHLDELVYENIVRTVEKLKKKFPTRKPSIHKLCNYLITVGLKKRSFWLHKLECNICGVIFKTFNKVQAEYKICNLCYEREKENPTCAYDNDFFES